MVKTWKSWVQKKKDKRKGYFRPHLSMHWLVKENFDREILPTFGDLWLKYCIEREKTKNNISAYYYYKEVILGKRVGGSTSTLHSKLTFKANDYEQKARIRKDLGKKRQDHFTTPCTGFL